MKTSKPNVRALCASAALATALAVGQVGPAAGSGVQSGILTCENIPGSGINLIIHSVTKIRCNFKSTDGTVVEKYKGETGIGLGVDLSWKREDKIAFAVVTATKDIGPGNYFLAGKYLGGKANVTLGVGGGAASLVGGSKDSIGLQPLALEESKGLGVSGGLGYLYLEPDR